MQQTLYIGSNTNEAGKGVYRAALSGDGKLSFIDAFDSTMPSYLIFSDDRKILYAANEGREVNGVPGGAVTAFNVLGDGALKTARVSSTKGGSPCHILAHGGYLYGANYGDGTFSVFPLDSGGLPGELEFTHRHEGSGPVARRQEGPHAHCVMTVPGTDVFCAVDLGIDQARFYRKDGKSLALVQALSFDGGAGPRHVVFSKDGRFGWVVTELSNFIYCIEYKKSEWVINSKHSTLPDGFSGRSACAAIRLSPDGKLIAASNRFHDSVAVFGVGDADGSLSPMGIYPCGGATPRDIDFSPDGKWLLAANQDSDSVDVLSVDGGFSIVEGGKLAASKPTCILF